MPQNVHQTTLYIENPQLLGISLNKESALVTWWSLAYYGLTFDGMKVTMH